MARRPSALQLVAWLFLASGVWAAISIAAALFMKQRISLDLEVLGLWIGPGLLRHEARYRRWALRLLTVALCLAPIATLLLLVRPAPFDAKFLGRPVGTIPRPAALTVLAILVGVAVWQYWVLQQPSVAALFRDSTSDFPEASV